MDVLNVSAVSTLDLRTNISEFSEVQMTPGFRNELMRVAESSSMDYLEQLRDKLAEQGAILANRSDIKELQRYRECVSEFLNETLKYAYTFTKEDMLSSKGRHKVFANVRKVNENLEKLTQEVLSEQKDNLTIVGIVDDIRGLILDLFI